jgi:hypothetical protein
LLNRLFFVREGEKEDHLPDSFNTFGRTAWRLRDATKKISHGDETFFIKKRVFAMLSKNHHDDGHVGVIMPAAPGLQSRR